MRIRCPHCRQPVEVVDAAPFADVECPSCGSRFNLTGEETATYQPKPPESLGHFRFLKQLGVGAFGSVWQAHDSELDRTVAVKIPRKEQLSPREAEVFLREARAVAQLRHPNIVSIHEVGREDGTVYLVSDFVDGVSLADWLTAQRPGAREAARLCEKIARAVGHAHEHGVIHRDLKPSNILLDARGEPHVTDFGLAKREAGEVTVTADGNVLGTPAYMSPEQARGDSHSADRRSDVYSLGVILFELLTGEKPFRGNSRMLLHQVIHDEAPSPRRLNGQVPRDLETVCLKCLQKDPKRRYADAGQLADDLGRHLRNEPILARPAGRIERAWRWARRRPAAAALIGVSLTSLLLLLAGAAWHNVRLSDANSRLSDANSRLGSTNARLKQAVVAVERERDNVAAAKRETADNLYRALMREARAVLLARQEGYRARVWESLRAAAAVESPLVDPRQIRREAVVALGDFAGLAPHDVVVPGPAVAADAAPGRPLLAVGASDGTVRLFDYQQNRPLGELASDGKPVRILRFEGRDRLVSFDAAGGCRAWQEDSAGRWVPEEREGPAGPFVPIALSSGGEFLLGASRGETVIWNLSERRAAGSTNAIAPRGGDAIAADGRTVVGLTRGAGPNRPALWRPDQEPRAAEPDVGGVQDLALSPDGKLVAYAGDSGFQLFDSASLTSAFLYRSDVIVRVCFSPDSQLLAYATPTQQVHILSIASSQVVASLTHPGPGTGPSVLRFSGDGRRLLSVRPESVRVWDLAGAAERLVLAGHAGGVPAVAFHPRKPALASVSKDGRLKLWDSRSGTLLWETPETSGPIQAVAFSHDGRWIATGGGRELVLWDSETGRKALAPQHPITRVLAVGFDPSGRYFAAAGFRMAVWRVETTSGGVALSREPLVSEDAQWSQYLQFVNESTLAWVDRQHLIKVTQIEPRRDWQLDGRLVLGWHGLAAFPDGRRVAFVSSAHTAEIWDVVDNKRLSRLDAPERLTSAYVAVDPAGRRLAGGLDSRRVAVWDAETGRMELAFREERSPVWSCAWSPGGRQLAVGLADGGMAIWDLDAVESALAALATPD